MLSDLARTLDKIQTDLNLRTGRTLGADWPENLPDVIPVDELGSVYYGDPRFYVWRISVLDLLSLVSGFGVGSIAVKVGRVLLDFVIGKGLELGLSSVFLPREEDEIVLPSVQRELLLYLSAYKMAALGFANVRKNDSTGKLEVYRA